MIPCHWHANLTSLRSCGGSSGVEANERWEATAAPQGMEMMSDGRDDEGELGRGDGGGDTDVGAAVELALRNERERRPPKNEITGTTKPRRRAKGQKTHNQKETARHARERDGAGN